MKTVLIAVLLAACGSTSAPAIDANTVAITAVTVTPSTLMLKRGLDVSPKLTAMATLSNGMVEDVTQSAIWSSSAPATATVAGGTVTALLSGSVTITATFGGMQGSAMVAITSPEMFVLDYSSGKALDVFDAYTTGNVPPLRRIVGPTTTFTEPIALVVYHDEIYVADYAANAIDVFPVAATGDVAPTRRITGAPTTLASPFGIAIVNDEIYVTSQSKILVFPITAGLNTVPTRTISGPTTTLQPDVYGLAVDHNEIYIANYPNRVLVFPANATGDVAPSRTISGATTTLNGCYGLWVANGEIFVSNSNSANVFLASASGDTPPIRRLIGPDVGAQIIGGVIMLGNELYVTDVGGFVSTFPREATSDTPPTRSVKGTMTTMQSAFSTAFY